MKPNAVKAPGKTGSIAIIILAAGLGTRMKSDRAKVLHEVEGVPMISHVVKTAHALGAGEIIVVIGHQAAQVQKAVSDYAHLKFAIQDRQLGTGHAVMCALPEVSAQMDHVVILCGDVPLLTPATVMRLIEDHVGDDRDVTVVAVEAPDPTGYGRIVMGNDQAVSCIVEEADASEAIKKIRTVNAGIYCVDRVFLKDALEKLEKNNSQGEFYLTDIVAIAHKENRSVGLVMADDPREVAGINTIAELQASEAALKVR